MYAQLLLEELEGISPEAKFFLLKFLQDYWDEHVVSLSNKELLESFGIYDKSVKRILTELLAKKYLGLEKRLTGARGRPKQALIKGEALQEIVEKWKIESVFIKHEQSIAKLLEVTTEREQIVLKQRRNSVDRENASEPPDPPVLTNTRKLLLCVLLAKADQFGVVRNLGMTELASLVGLSKQQLRWHLKILKGSQFLLTFIPGKSFRGMKGKLKSTFVLDLRWVESNKSDKHFVSLESEALKLLERAILLARDLRVVYKGLGREAFTQECMSHSDHWRDIYRIDKDVLETVVDSVDLFLNIHDTGAPASRRLYELVCELTMSMLTSDEDGLHSLLSLEDIIKRLSQEAKKRKLGVGGWRVNGGNGLELLAKFVWLLYKEILMVIKRGNSENGSVQIAHCQIHSLFDTTLLMHLNGKGKG